MFSYYLDSTTLDTMRTCLLIVLWACLSQLGDAKALFERTTDVVVKEGMVVGRGDDGWALKRSKRGWMWNQFFLLEEYTGSDYQYVGKVSFFFFLFVFCIDT